MAGIPAECFHESRIAPAVGKFVIPDEWPHLSRRVSTIGLLHLEHIGSVVSEKLGTVRTSYMMGEVQYLDIR